MKSVITCTNGRSMALLAGASLLAAFPAGADFTVDLGSGTYTGLQTYEVTHGSVSGQIAGFAISFDYDPMASGGSWASDMTLALSADGTYFAGWGGYNAYLFEPSTPWAFDGAGSAPAGTYTDTIIFSTPLDGSNLGSFGVGIMNGYTASGDVGYNNFIVTFFDEASIPSGSCCIGGECFDGVTQADCLNNSGFYQGDDTVCDEDSCSSGANDECGNAIEVTMGNNIFDTTEATNSTDPYDDAECPGNFLGVMNQDLWFTFSPPATGAYEFHTCNSASFDTDLVIYEGDCEEMIQIACSGDGTGLAGCQIYYSRIDGVTLSSSMTYTIRIGGYSAASAGWGDLQILEDVPGNCCIDGACYDDVTEFECSNNGGIYGGDGSNCAASPCPQPGNCCMAGECFENTPQDDCVASGGIYMGDDETCDSSPCPIPGNCCMGGECFENVPASDCTANGGLYMGDNETCESSPCPVPSADECGLATEVVLGSNSFSTIGATNSSDPYNTDQCAGTLFGGMYHDVWFYFIPPESGSYDFTTCQSGSFDTDLVIYEGDCEEMVQIACNGDQVGTDQPGCQIFYSLINGLGMSAGTTYTIRIGGYGSATMGTGNLQINEDIPGNCCMAGECFDSVGEADCMANGGLYMGDGSTCASSPCPVPGNCCMGGECFDNVPAEDCAANGGLYMGDNETCESAPCPIPSPDECSGATEVVLGGNSFSTVGATDSPEAWDPLNCSVLGAMNQDVWFYFNPPGAGTISLHTCLAGSFDTDLVVYEGDCEELVQVACNGDGSGLTGCQAYYSHIPALEVVPDTTYIIRIGSWADNVSGAGVLEISGDLDPGGECPEDVDGSDDVGFNDLLAVLAAWGSTGGPEDVDGSGEVGFNDLLAVLAAWGPC